MPDMKKLDKAMFVTGQIRPDDVADLAARGIMMIVNNRPDGEEPGQPPASEIAAAAEAAGLGYRHIPVAGLSPTQVADMTEALEAATGPVLAFCKSGTRSTFLWALARAGMGDDAGELADKAAAAGYDITPIRPYLP